MDFIGSHILSVDQFVRGDIDRLFAVADDLAPYASRLRITRVLQGAILSNMFFEPSTRTRVSFGCAFNLLGGDVRETTEVKSSALAKGESLYDTARVLSGYSDVIVMRHPEIGSVAEFATASRVPVINAGDGANEHPSQALLDLYTVRQEIRTRGRSIDGLRIAVVGDLKYGRAVHSLLKLLALFDGVSVHLVSPPGLEAPDDVVASLLDGGHAVEVYHDLGEGIHHVDILYVTRTQEERFASSEEADRYRGCSASTRPSTPRTASRTPLSCIPCPGFTRPGPGTRRRPHRQPEPRDLPPDGQRRGSPHGALRDGSRRGRPSARPCPAGDVVHRQTHPFRPVTPALRSKATYSLSTPNVDA